MIESECWSRDEDSGAWQWSGTATQLLNTLGQIAYDKKKERDWPTNATALSGKLRRVASVLRKAKPRIDIKFDRKDLDRKRTRKLILSFQLPESDGKTASAASAASEINIDREVAASGTASAQRLHSVRSARNADAADAVLPALSAREKTKKVRVCNLTVQPLHPRSRLDLRNDGPGNRPPRRSRRSTRSGAPSRRSSAAVAARGYLTRRWLQCRNLTDSGELNNGHRFDALSHIHSLAPPVK